MIKVNIVGLKVNIVLGDVLIMGGRVSLYPRSITSMVQNINAKARIRFNNKSIALGLANKANYIMTDEDVCEFTKDIEAYNRQLKEVKEKILIEYETYVDRLYSSLREVGLRANQITIPTKEEIENSFFITFESTELYVKEDNEKVKHAFISNAVNSIKMDVVELVGKNLEFRGELTSMVKNRIKCIFDKVKSRNIFDIPELNEMCQNSENLDIVYLIVKCKELETKYNLK